MFEIILITVMKKIKICQIVFAIEKRMENYWFLTAVGGNTWMDSLFICKFRSEASVIKWQTNIDKKKKYLNICKVKSDIYYTVSIFFREC